MENPTSQIAASVPISDTGMASIGISVARASRRNRKITAVTISTDRPSAISTSWIAPSMKIGAVRGDEHLHILGQKRLQVGHHLRARPARSPACCRSPAG